MWQPVTENAPPSKQVVIVKAHRTVPTTAYRHGSVWYYAGTGKRLQFEPTHYLKRGGDSG